MNRNEMLLIGVGQAGGNIVSEILKKDDRYIGLFINTSQKDLLNVDNAKNIYLIPNADGTGRNRNVAKGYGKEYYSSIIDQIDKFPLQKTLYIFFSLGGGTGSGLSPTLVKMISMLSTSEKQIHVVGIAPSLAESKRAKQNAKDCWNEISMLPNVCTHHILDNNKRDNKKDINIDFAEKFEAMIRITEPNLEGEETIDNGDMGVLTSSKGASAIYFLPEEADTKVAIAKGIKNSIYADFSKDECKYLAISLKIGSNLDRNTIVNYFEPSEDQFVYGSNDICNMVVVTGASLSLQKGLIELFDLSISEQTNTRKEDSPEDLIVGEINKPKIKKENKDELPLEGIRRQKEKRERILKNDAFWDIFN